jgi:hypothetical protein
MTSHQIAISHSVPKEAVVRPLALHLTRGVLASALDETRGMTDALIGPPETAMWQQEAGFSEW